MEISLNPMTIVSIVTLSLGSFFLGYLLLARKKRSPADILLAIILMVLMAELFYDLLIYSRLMYQFPYLFGLNGFGGLALYPLLFFYTLSIGKRTFHWKGWYFMAFLPFAVGFFYKASRYWRVKGGRKLDMLDAFYQHTRPGPTDYFSNNMLLWAKILIPALFLAGALYQLRKIKKELSTPLPFYLQGLQWVLLLSLVYVLTGDFVNKGLYSWLDDNFIEWMVNIALISCLLVMLVYLLLRKLETGPDLFPEIKYKDSRLDKTASLQYFQRLSQMIQKEEMYLDPDLSLSILAQKMKVNSKYLSQAINENQGISFSRFINQFRVERAKQLLRDESFYNFSIEGIAKEVGFRSKSAFYRAFREMTGLSPKDYQSRSDS